MAVVILKIFRSKNLYKKYFARTYYIYYYFLKNYLGKNGGYLEYFSRTVLAGITNFNLNTKKFEGLYGQRTWTF